jgi:hypothetical protein
MPKNFVHFYSLRRATLLLPTVSLAAAALHSLCPAIADESALTSAHQHLNTSVHNADKRAALQALREVIEGEEQYYDNLTDEDQSKQSKFATALGKKERLLLSIRSGGKSYRPLAVEAAPVLKDYKCSFRGEDAVLDSCFYLSGEPSWYKNSIIPYARSQQMVVDMPWRADQLERFDVYSGDPHEMHASGYKHIIKLGFDRQTGQIRYRASNVVADQALFIIMKAKDEKCFRRFTFVVLPKPAPDRHAQNPRPQNSSRHPKQY